MAEQTIKKEMTFLEHLEELRWHIIRSLIAVALLFILAVFFKRVIFDYIILAPKNPDFISYIFLCKIGEIVHTDQLCIHTMPFQIINITLSGQFLTHMTISLFAGVILSFPYIIYEFWRFIGPALYPNEKRYAKGSVFYSSILFFIGVLFGYFILLPLSLNFLGTYQVSTQVMNQITLKSYISTVASICLSCGIVFELPIIIYFLSKIGIMTPAFMRKYRRHAIIVNLIIAAIVTPTVDIFSMTLVAVPLILLYEVSIFISSRVLKNRKKANANI